MSGAATGAESGARIRASDALLLAAVAVAFADSSIVVLAIPEILVDLDVSISSASWVITAYNVAVVAAGAVLVALANRLPARLLAAAGFTAFGLASAGCAVVSTFGPLVAFRAVQGAAAALVLVSAVRLLRGRHGVGAWILAATVGLAAGPALGGLLTEFFTWRSIFVVQAPLVAVGLAALFARPLPLEPTAERRTARAWLADLALATLSAALVGALFLVVVLLISGFGWDPLDAALAATTLPLLALVAERAGRALPAALAVVAGGLLAAAGLATLGLVPGARTELILAGLALCGTGLGLAAQPLGRLALAGGELTRDAAWTVVARHAGLVVALLLVTPVLVSSLDGLEQDAEGAGGELVLRSQLPLDRKIPLLLDLADAARAAEVGLPDIDATLRPYERGDGSVTRLADRLEGTLHDLVARSFREPFLLCAGFGLLTALLGLGLGPSRTGVRAGPAAGLVVLAVAGAVAALAAALRLGALDPPTRLADACRAPKASIPGNSTDAITQRVALRSLAGAACELGTSRTTLLRELTGTGSGRWSEQRLEEALRPQLLAAIDAERDSGALDSTTAFLLRALASNASIGLIRQALESLGVTP